LRFSKLNPTMDRFELLEAQVVMLRQQVARLETQMMPQRGGGVVDESVAARLVREFGGEWEHVKRGAKDAKSCTARACTVRTLIERAEWTQRRVAVTMGMSRQAVQKCLGKLPSRLANLRRR
jgi:hypothetical protein